MGNKYILENYQKVKMKEIHEVLYSESIRWTYREPIVSGWNLTVLSAYHLLNSLRELNRYFNNNFKSHNVYMYIATI